MKYDKRHVDKIIKSLQEGDGRVRATNAAGIHYSTFLDWMQRHSEFSESVKKAEDAGNDKLKDLCKRRILEDKSWQSAAWWLERNFKDEYALRHEIKGNMDIETPQISVVSKEITKEVKKLIKKFQDE